MTRVLLFLALAILPLMSGCGNSPYDAGKAFAKGIISSLESGDPSQLQKAMADAQAKAQAMPPTDAAEFMKGYNEVALPYIQSKMPNMPKMPN